MNFEKFKQEHPFDIGYNFEKPLVLDGVLGAYFKLYGEEIDAALETFYSKIKKVKRWTENFESQFKEFPVAIYVFKVISFLQYPVRIKWEEETNTYDVSIWFSAFILKESLGENYYEDDNDFWIYLAPTLDNIDRERAILRAIESKY